MRIVDMHWHALDDVPSAGNESLWLRKLAKGALRLAFLTIALLLGAASNSRAADGEIRIGNTMPYSGPASAYGIIGKTIAAYFNKINAEGGINGRKINFISYDDGYNPQKTVELTQKLVEDDKVLLIFASLGTATSAAVRPYLNANKIPQLFVASGASMWDQPRDFPWTMGFQPSYQTEAHIYAQYLLEKHPNGGKIAILYQDDDIRQGLRQRHQRRARRQDSGRCRGGVQDHRRQRQSTDRHAQGLRRRHLFRRNDPEICRDGDPANRRARLETRAHHIHGFNIGRCRDAACRPAKFRRGSVGRILLGRRRSGRSSRSGLP